jgi:2-methylisocitrate lyase-like PEP mutase family enzyme
MGKKLRTLMSQEAVVAPFLVDGVQALLCRQEGFKAGYITGFGIASTLGLPDVGLVTLTQMGEKLRSLTAVCDLPFVVDADTGYGNYINAMFAVKEYERAGAAALHLEDQVWPKRCGYMAGKQVIPTEDAAAKIKAAVDARQDGDFIIIARTDALAVDGWNAVEDRLRTYTAAGADMVFVDGIKNIDDMAEYERRMGDLPAIFNNVARIALDKITRASCFRIILHPLAMSRAWAGYEQGLKLIKEGASDSTQVDYEAFNRIITLLGAPAYFALDKKYGAKLSGETS